jgi:hypothetical protein
LPLKFSHNTSNRKKEEKKQVLYDDRRRSNHEAQGLQKEIDCPELRCPHTLQAGGQKKKKR